MDLRKGDKLKVKAFRIRFMQKGHKFSSRKAVCIKMVHVTKESELLQTLNWESRNKIQAITLLFIRLTL